MVSCVYFSSVQPNDDPGNRRFPIYLSVKFSFLARYCRRGGGATIVVLYWLRNLATSMPNSGVFAGTRLANWSSSVNMRFESSRRTLSQEANGR